MAATFIDISGAQPHSGMQIDGLSVVPVWKGQTDTLKTSILTESGFSKGIITKDFKYIAIRYNEEALKRGFEPPETGGIREHIENNSFDILWEKGPFGQPRDNIGGIVDRDQLYDLRKDPGETQNLAQNQDYQEVLKVMQSHLYDYVQAIGRPFGEFSGSSN